eukprot:492598-Rhodomonas_salina.2
MTGTDISPAVLGLNTHSKNKPRSAPHLRNPPPRALCDAVILTTRALKGASSSATTSLSSTSSGTSLRAAPSILPRSSSFPRSLQAQLCSALTWRGAVEQHAR